MPTKEEFMDWLQTQFDWIAKEYTGTMQFLVETTKGHELEFARDLEAMCPPGPDMYTSASACL